ncbi:MAG: ParB/RepB/Spo0J family partition protein [Acinetobacter sp.]
MDYQQLINELNQLPLDEKINQINILREAIHNISPFKSEPVDFVKWVKGESVHANDYNPNSVAPPEMELLRVSINADGYTQPIVSMSDNDAYEVIDGFHRNRCGKEYSEINARVHGYLPLVQIRSTQEDKTDRMASTIRHNRARGKHRVESMSEIVIELKKRNWSDAKIAKNLGMDEDEILRLCQISGLQEVFSSDSFSQAWTATLTDQELLDCLDESDVDSEDDDSSGRVFHEWQDWECFPAGFYKDKPPQGMTAPECEEAYRAFLADIPLFDSVMNRVASEWKNSCEHYLTNEKMNRIAWLGQASMCLHTGVPARFCGGYNLLTDSEKQAADFLALQHLNKWLKANGREELSWESSKSKSKADLY